MNLGGALFWRQFFTRQGGEKFHITTTAGAHTRQERALILRASRVVGLSNPLCCVTWHQQHPKKETLIHVTSNAQKCCFFPLTLVIAVLYCSPDWSQKERQGSSQDDQSLMTQKFSSTFCLIALKKNRIFLPASATESSRLFFSSLLGRMERIKNK